MALRSFLLVWTTLPLLSVAPSAATATVVVTTASAFARTGGFGIGEANVAVENGAHQPGSPAISVVDLGNPGAAASVTTSTLTPSTNPQWVEAAAAGGWFGGTAGGALAAARAEADRKAGDLRVHAETSGLDFAIFRQGSVSAEAVLRGELKFNNKSDEPQPQQISLLVTGVRTVSSFVDFLDVPMKAFASLGLFMTSYCDLYCISFTPDGLPVNSDVRAEIDEAWEPGQRVRFRDLVSGQILNGGAEGWAVGALESGPATARSYLIEMYAFLWLPPGESTLLVDTRLGITHCLVSSTVLRSTVCDFGNTASLRLGTPAPGVEVFSLGGGFLGLPTPGGSPPPIPEPATWAMLVSGFGLVGSAIRRRRTRAA